MEDSSENSDLKILDLGQICRACLAVPEDQIQIFNTASTCSTGSTNVTVTYNVQITELTQLEVRPRLVFFI